MVLKVTTLLLSLLFFLDSSSSYVMINGTVDSKTPIIGGSTSPIARARHHVQLVTVARDILGRTQQQYLCGGSLITNDIVLTAAHCTQPISQKGNVEVLAGSSHLYDYVQKRSGVYMYVHPRFSMKHIKNTDIALIKLNRPFTSSKIVPIPIALERTRNFERVRVHGFGYYDRTMQPSPVLKQLTSKVTPCSLRPDICIRNPPGLGTCFGDSGSGLVNTKHEIVGIVSRGSHSGCASGHLDLYASVYAHLKFISTGLKRLSPDDKLARKIIKSIRNVLDY